MTDYIKKIRLSLGQVLVILSNALIVFGWGMRIESSVSRIGEIQSEVREEVEEVHWMVDDLNLRTTVIEDRLDRPPTTGGGG